MDSEGCRVLHHHLIEGPVEGDDQVEKIEGWEPLERQPFDGTVVDIRDESRPPWPSIKEIEPVLTELYY
jgi:hypothetical protein